jgi:plastocyanin
VVRRLLVVRKFLTVFAVAVPLAVFPLALAACGDDDDDGGETTAAAETTTEDTTTETTTEEPAGGGGGGETVDVSLKDFSIDPADPTVKAGTVTFAVSNDGETVHNLEIEGDGLEEELSSDLSAGDSGDLTVDLQPGTYEWYCPIGNHRDLGMEGEVTVN